MRNINYQKMMELLSVILHCPVCNNKYNAEQTSIVESKDPEKYENSSMLVHTDCERCRASVFFSISMDGPETFSVAMVTDLTSGDAQKFKKTESISVDEVIGFHAFLNEFDGDFAKVIH